jgi:hypothetical protein
MNDQIKTKINELFAECIKAGRSIIAIPCDANSYGIGIGGNTHDLFTTLASVIKSGKTGERDDPSKALLYDLIMDAVSINFSPNEIVEEIDRRINKLIP